MSCEGNATSFDGQDIILQENHWSFCTWWSKICFHERLVVRLQNKAKVMFWMVVVPTTRLGDTLVELQLSKWTLFVKRKSNTSRSIVQLSVHLGFHTFLIIICSIFQALGWLTRITSQFNIVVLIGFRDILVQKQYSHQSLSFISVVAPLLAGLDNTPRKSHRNESMTPLPVRLVSTPMELLESPLCSWGLFCNFPYSSSFFQTSFTFSFFSFFIFVTMHKTYSFQRKNRDPNLLRVEEVAHIEK